MDLWSGAIEMIQEWTKKQRHDCFGQTDAQVAIGMLRGRRHLLRHLLPALQYIRSLGKQLFAGIGDFQPISLSPDQVNTQFLLESVKT